MEKQTAVERVTETIALGIENGTFSPGEALPAQRQLAESFGVSRMVIREAVKVLEGQGVLKSQPGSGIYVMRPTRVPAAQLSRGTPKHYTVREILTMCRMLWGTCMFDVCKSASQEALLRLKEQNEKISRQGSCCTPHQKFIYETSFGMRLVELSGNTLVCDFLNEVLKATTEIDRLIVQHPDYHKLLENDALLLDALLCRDGYRAYFLSMERDHWIDRLISDRWELMEKTFPVYIKQ